MKKSHIILPFLLIVVLSSCYTSKISYTNLNIIQRGMSSEEVISILGNPNYRNFDDKQEILEFRSSEYGTAKVAKIWFVDDRVIEMKSYLDSYENCHNRDNTTKENKKDKSSEEDTSSRI